MTNLMICPKAGECKDCGSPSHRKPHIMDSDSNCLENEGKGKYSSRKCPPCIPCVREIKVGGMVRVSESLRETVKRRHWAKEMLGFIGTKQVVKSDSGDCVGLSGSYYYWPKEDLELIQEDDMQGKAKYKWKGDAQSIISIFEQSRVDCGEFYDELADFIKYARPARLANILELATLIAWAEQKPERITWLLGKGYIEEVQSEMDIWKRSYPEGRFASLHDKVEWAKRMPR